MKRFLYGTLINTLLTLIGFIFTVSALPVLIRLCSDPHENPVRTYFLVTAVVASISASAAFLHVRHTAETEPGPVPAILGACGVTTGVYALLSVPVLMQFASPGLILTVIATAASGGLLGGSLGVPLRGN